MERFFNTAGPNIPEDSYTLDPLKRLDLEDIITLIRQKRYFVLHAPRQTGKTSCVLALRDHLNASGEYIAVYANVEGGQAARNDIKSVVRTVCGSIAEAFRLVVDQEIPLQLRERIDSVDPNEMLKTYLRLLTEAFDKPLVLILDEIDALVGDGLVSVLRQIPPIQPHTLWRHWKYRCRHRFYIPQLLH